MESRKESIQIILALRVNYLLGLWQMAQDLWEGLHLLQEEKWECCEGEAPASFIDVCRTRFFLSALEKRQDQRGGRSRWRKTKGRRDALIEKTRRADGFGCQAVSIDGAVYPRESDWPGTCRILLEEKSLLPSPLVFFLSSILLPLPSIHPSTIHPPTTCHIHPPTLLSTVHLTTHPSIYLPTNSSVHLSTSIYSSTDHCILMIYYIPELLVQKLEYICEQKSRTDRKSVV